MASYRSSILTIGTEVCSGQIINTNASWLADQLANLKYEPTWHITVPDSEQEILEALDFLSRHSDFIFVTGGLGPTTDDITCKLVCRWSQDRLQFDPASWKKIEQRFFQLGIQPPDSNRQQCMFPTKAKIIDNPRGTANAFSISYGQQHIWCLPGPPEEIKAIWKSSLGADLEHRIKDVDPYLLFRWQCLGLSESALGEIVEKIIAGSSLVSGYRPHFPYVEIKIWCRSSQLKTQQTYLDRLENSIKTWLITRNDEDCIDAFFQAIATFPKIHIEDAASFGALGERIGLSLSQGKKASPLISYRTDFYQRAIQENKKLESDTLLLQLGPVNSDGTWLLDWRTTHVHRQTIMKLPFQKDPFRFDRERRYVCEMSLVAWSQYFQGATLA